MIAFITLAAAIMPPALEGPYDWCVRRYVDYEVKEAYCTQPQDVPPPVIVDNLIVAGPHVNLAPVDATAARKRMLEQYGKIAVDRAQFDTWSKRTSLTTPATSAVLEWRLPATPGTFVRVTVTNRARYFSVVGK